MEVTTERLGHVLIASVIGRIEPAGAQTLQTKIIGAVQNGDRAVVMDFEQLDYIGNVGLRVLRIIGRILRDRNAALVVCSPHGVVSAVFAGTGVDMLIKVYPTRAAALEALAG